MEARAANAESAVCTTMIKVVNNLLAKNYRRGSIKILQDSIINAYSIATGTSRHNIFCGGYLNFEEAFRAQGWHVEYCKPAHDESFDAYFHFKPKQ